MMSQQELLDCVATEATEQIVAAKMERRVWAGGWSEGWQRLMDIASREYDERALKYRARCEHIYQRTMAAHERDWLEGVGGMTPNAAIYDGAN